MKYLMMPLEKAAAVWLVHYACSNSAGCWFWVRSIFFVMLLYQNRPAESFVNIFSAKSGRTWDLLFLCSCIGGENSARSGGLQEMSSQICSRDSPLVCSGIKCERSYESETCFRAQCVVFEKEPTISLSEPVTSSKCPQRSGEGCRGSGLLQRCQSCFQTSRS